MLTEALPNPSRTYATRSRAVGHLKQVLGQSQDQFRWLILVTEDGRYAPAVIGGMAPGYIALLASNGICVLA